MSILDLLNAKNSGGNSAGKLKKNTQVTEKPPQKQSPQVSTPPKTPDKPVIDSADIEQIKQHWDKIVDFAKSSANARIADLLKKAVPLRLSNSTLALGFDASDEFSMKLCQSNGRQEIIESVLSDSLGTKVKIVFETIDTAAKAAPKPKPPGAKASKKTIDEIADTPAVKTILSELDASILDVTEEDGG